MFPHGQQPRWGIGQQQNFRAGMMPRSNVSGADLMGQRLVQMGPQMGAQIQQVSVMRQQTITANTPSWGSPSVNVSQRMNIISQAQQIQTQQIQAQQIQQQQIQAQQIQTQQIQAQQIRVQQLRAQAQQIPNQQQVMVQQLNAMQNNQLQNQRMQQIQSHFQNMARSLSGQPGTLPVSSQQNNLYQVRNASVWRCPDDRDKKNRPPSTDSNRSHSSRKESGSSNRKSPSRNLSRSSSSRDRYGNSSERREYRRNSYENDGSDSACRKSDDSRDQRHRWSTYSRWYKAT